MNSDKLWRILLNLSAAVISIIRKEIFREKHQTKKKRRTPYEY